MIDEEFIRVQYQMKACKVKWLLSKAKKKQDMFFYWSLGRNTLSFIYPDIGKLK